MNETAQERHNRLNMQSLQNSSKQSIQPKSHDRNDGALRLWQANARLAGYDWRIMNDKNCANYVGWRLRTNGVHIGKPPQASTIKTDLSKIKTALEMRGYSNPNSSKENMPITNRGIAGSKTDSKKAAPINKHLLREMFRNIRKKKMTYDNYVEIVFLAHAKECIRRSQELLRPDLKSPQDIRHNKLGGITAGMVRFGDKEAMSNPSRGERDAWLIFAASKKDTAGDKLQVSHMVCSCGPDKHDPFPCALHSLIDLWNVRRSHPFGPHSKLLRLANGDVADYQWALDLVKRLASECGLNPKLYGTHSCRRGGVQDSQRAGLCNAYINNQGGWCSKYGKAPYESKSYKKLRKEMRKLRKQKENL